MSYASGCKCHGATFCPDLICIGYEDGVPVFVRKDSKEGQAAIRFRKVERQRADRREYERLRRKFGHPGD